MWASEVAVWRVNPQRSLLFGGLLGDGLLEISEGALVLRQSGVDGLDASAILGDFRLVFRNALQ